MGGTRFEEGETELQHGDRLFLYTDGIPEFANPAGDLYGEHRFHAQLLHGRGGSLDAVCSAVMNSLRIFGEGRQAQDDVTLLAIEYRHRPAAAGLPLRRRVRGSRPTRHRKDSHAIGTAH
jgi:sigma-B regulation protein RsbU (phosphoserine phosphatase)